MSMSPITRYELWQHLVTSDRWLIRVEYDTVTGLHGPLPPGPLPPEPEYCDFEDHPDDLEWIVRAADSFTVRRNS